MTTFLLLLKYFFWSVLCTLLQEVFLPVTKLLLEYNFRVLFTPLLICDFILNQMTRVYRKTLGTGMVLADKNAVVATGDGQAVGANATVVQMVGANAEVGHLDIHSEAGNKYTFKRK